MATYVAELAHGE